MSSGGNERTGETYAEAAARLLAGMNERAKKTRSIEAGNVPSPARPGRQRETCAAPVKLVADNDCGRGGLQSFSKQAHGTADTPRPDPGEVDGHKDRDGCGPTPRKLGGE
jgi:hypothetical protein